VSRRLPIESTRRVVFGRLPSAERERLVDEVYALWSEYFVGLTRERFVATHLFDQTRITLFYGGNGELAGFFNVNTDVVEAGGHRCVVITSGIFSRVRYDATRAIGLAAFREAMRVRIRHPRTPLAYLPIATSPVSYRTVSRWTKTFHPTPDAEPPAYVSAMVAEVARRRRLETRPDDPWVTRFLVRQRRAGDIQASRTMKNPGRFAEYFLRRVPTWTEGDSLLIWVPFDLHNSVGSLARLLLNRPRT
jgi:hypothetical protein